MPRLRPTPLLLICGCLLGAARPALAVPLLQLDIKNGVYQSADETTYATAQSFTLYAYLTPPAGTSASALRTLLNDTYYVAAALSPKVDEGQQNLGSFTFNGTKVHATQDMVWGNPPFEPLLGGAAYDVDDLARQDVYDTYFKEFSFKFTSLQRAVTFDAPTTEASVPTESSTGGMYFMAFQVNTSHLNPNYSIHFDLFSETLKSGADLDINKYAPFTHDAQSMLGGGVTNPEPASLLLLGTGVVGLAMRVRRKRAVAQTGR